jgi:hypothetical protein
VRVTPKSGVWEAVGRELGTALALSLTVEANNTQAVRASKAPNTYTVGEYVPDYYTAIRYLSLDETLAVARMIIESAGR